jgi:hypothetical protein
MGTTLDHLFNGCRVRVIQGFVDSHGLACAEDEEGVIGAIDLDLNAMEVSVVFTPDGAAARRLAFSLKSREGPGNGRMKAYFEEIGRADLRPLPPPPPPAEPAPRAIRRPEIDLASLDERQPREEISLHDITVACACDPAFHRPVLGAWALGVNACLRCGTVTVTRQVGDDGRFTGDAWTAYWTVPTPQPVLDWLGFFPRMSVNHAGAPDRWPMSANLVRYPTLYYPAGRRVEDAEALAALDAQLTSAQAGLTRAQAVRPLLGNLPPAPKGLSENLRSFASLRAASLLTKDSPLDQLLSHAHPGLAGSMLAVEILLQRADAFDVMAEALASADEDRFMAGVAMARDWDGADPHMAPLMIAIMSGLSLEPAELVPNRVRSCLKFEALLVAILDMKLAAPAMMSDLSARQKSLVRKDRYTAEYMGIALVQLRGTA